MEGSTLRGVEALVSDTRAKIAQVKALIDESLETGDSNEGLRLIEEAQSILKEIDDRS